MKGKPNEIAFYCHPQSLLLFILFYVFRFISSVTVSTLNDSDNSYITNDVNTFTNYTR